MVHLGWSMIILLWSEIAVLSSAVYLALINANLGDCVTVNGNMLLCNCVESDNHLESGIHRWLVGDGCKPETQSSVDVPVGANPSAPTVYISSGFISSNTKDVNAWATFSGSLRFAPGVKEIFFDFATNCLTDRAGKQLLIESKACLPKHRLKELNPYYEQPFDLRISNLDTEKSDASTQQAPSTNLKTSASTDTNNEIATNAATDTAEKTPIEKTNASENPEDANLENNTPLPSRRRRRRRRNINKRLSTESSNRKEKLQRRLSKR